MGLAILIKRFEEIQKQLETVEATKHHKSGDYISGDYVDEMLRVNWTTKARNLISMACGPQSDSIKIFDGASEHGSYSTNANTIQKQKAVFQAIREDYEGGLFESARKLVQAEVFADELDQARELFQNQYIVAAAVIAGVVLETTMRQLCADHGVPTGQLNRMNDDLVKASAYNALVAKRVTAIAAIRNSAAHGKPEEFTKDDVRLMIEQVEVLVTDFVYTNAR